MLKKTALFLHDGFPYRHRHRHHRRHHRHSNRHRHRHRHRHHRRRPMIAATRGPTACIEIRSDVCKKTQAGHICVFYPHPTQSAICTSFKVRPFCMFLCECYVHPISRRPLCMLA